MPYIKHYRRTPLNFLGIAKTCGELNYILTKKCLDYLKIHGESYQTYNDIIGALENCKLELYRRRISNYEDKKIAENGDVK